MHEAVQRGIRNRRSDGVGFADVQVGEKIAD